jgi:hypothetical protein
MVSIIFTLFIRPENMSNNIVSWHEGWGMQDLAVEHGCGL